MPRIKRKYVCKICNKEYLGRSEDYCSTTCSNKARTGATRNKVQKPCAHCGRFMNLTPFIAQVQKYCSRECADHSKITSVTCKCQTCGNKFLEEQQRIARGQGKYCSKACYGKAISKTKAQICPQCNKTFVVPHWKMNKGNGKYCSIECFGLAHRTMVERECDNCGKTFQVKPSSLEKGEGMFCSKKCHFGHRGETNIERMTREELEKRNIPYVQEKQFGRYTADFYLPDQHSVIECDGEYWHSLPKAIQSAKRKDAFLKKEGITVFRFPEAAIKENVSALVDNMLNQLTL